MYRNDYKCISIKNDIWFEFKDHRWTEIESGFTLMKKMTNDVAKEFMKYHSLLANRMLKKKVLIEMLI